MRISDNQSSSGRQKEGQVAADYRRGRGSSILTLAEGLVERGTGRVSAAVLFGFRMKQVSAMDCFKKQAQTEAARLHF